MSTIEFERFLRAAKSATYAGQTDASSVTPLLQDSKQLEFRDGSYFYRDIYVGMFRFVGQEIVYLSERAIWSMSYSGGLVDGVPPASAKSIYSALRKALLNAPPQLPVRGPARLEVDDLTYRCQCEGSLVRFQGAEFIAQGGKIVYELRFSGGKLA